MSIKRYDCQSMRGELLEWACEMQAGDLPMNLRSHLEQCSSCARYHQGLSLVPELFNGPALYTAVLRERTMRAIRLRPERAHRWVLPGSIPVAVLGLLMTFIVPVWLGSKVLEYWIPSHGLATITALISTTLYGVSAACCCATALFKYRGDSANLWRSRMEEFHG